MFQFHPSTHISNMSWKFCLRHTYQSSTKTEKQVSIHINNQHNILKYCKYNEFGTNCTANCSDVSSRCTRSTGTDTNTIFNGQNKLAETGWQTTTALRASVRFNSLADRKTDVRCRPDRSFVINKTQTVAETVTTGSLLNLTKRRLLHNFLIL